MMASLNIRPSETAVGALISRILSCSRGNIGVAGALLGFSLECLNLNLRDTPKVAS
jgi:hypothetical protein